MIHLHQSLEAWGTPRFPDVLKNEVEQLDDAQLPLQAGLAETRRIRRRARRSRHDRDLLPGHRRRVQLRG